MTLRLRITIMLVVGMLLAGVIALGINAVVYEQSVISSPTQLQDSMLSQLGVSRAVAEAYVRAHPEAVFNSASDKPVNGGQSVNGAFQAALKRAQRDATNRSRLWSGIAILILAVVTGALAWLFAGRALRPVRLLTSRARTASAADLSARVGLSGPDDELKDLADTFDAMLARLEQSFAAQRRFSAQASHELRTPLAVIRSEADLLLAESADAGVRRPVESIRAATLRAERLVTALLALGRSESGHIDAARLQLDELIGDTVAEVVPSMQSSRLQVDVELHPAVVAGDRALIDCLTRNVLENAVRHNEPGGWINACVATTEVDGHVEALLEVRNSTPAYEDTANAPRGHGIGLTVVDAIAAAHGGRTEYLRTEPGVFAARVHFPVAERVEPRGPPSTSTLVVTDHVDSTFR
jgi:signal transduction histidine kinase